MDLIESSIIADPKTPTEVFCNKIYTYVKENREVLGYPVGSKTGPYLFVTNDLSGKMAEFLQMVKKVEKDTAVQLALMKEVVGLLIETYDYEAGKKKDGCSCCCGFYHSITKEQAQEIKDCIDCL